MSDGECNEGSVWETAMLAPARELGNLCAIVDYNRWQATGRSDEILALHPLAEKWRAFGWRTLEVDGHDITALSNAIRSVQASALQPTAIIAHTTKGKGVSFMEDDNNWHYRIPSADEVEAARTELGIAHAVLGRGRP
jgi:transketolase